MHGEVDGAHDAVAEFLVDDCLQGHVVDLHDLVEAVVEGVGGDDGAEAFAGAVGECGGDCGVDVEGGGESLGLFRGGVALAVEEGGDRDVASRMTSSQTNRHRPPYASVQSKFSLEQMLLCLGIQAACLAPKATSRCGAGDGALRRARRHPT